jgi:hypothetical protein
MAVSDVREPAVKNIQITTDDSVRLELRFKSLGLPVDMSQYDGSVAPILDPTNEIELDQWAVDLTDAATGVIVLTLTTTQTTALCPCDAVWYFQAIDTTDADNNSHTLIVGDFKVLKRRGFGG